MPSFACIVLEYDFVCVYPFDLCCLWCLLNRCHLYFQLKQPFTVQLCCFPSTKVWYMTVLNPVLPWELTVSMHRRSTRGQGWRMYDAPNGHLCAWIVPITWEDFPVINHGTQNYSVCMWMDVTMIYDLVYMMLQSGLFMYNVRGLFMLHPTWNRWDIF